MNAKSPEGGCPGKGKEGYNLTQDVCVHRCWGGRGGGGEFGTLVYKRCLFIRIQCGTVRTELVQQLPALLWGIPSPVESFRLAVLGKVYRCPAWRLYKVFGCCRGSCSSRSQVTSHLLGPIFPLELGLNFSFSFTNVRAAA